ncbi:hypothetical protein ACEPPN_006478 [Leptodophora sp. 'Broadleaf-Isolate-01']
MSQPPRDETADSHCKIFSERNVFEYGSQGAIPTLNNIDESVSEVTKITIEDKENDAIQAAKILHDSARVLTPSDMALAPELASVRAPYLGEDSRVTQLRYFDEKLQEWAAPNFGDHLEKQEQYIVQIGMTVELARFYQLTTRGAIRDLQRKRGQLERDLWELQSKYATLERNHWSTCADLTPARERESLYQSEHELGERVDQGHARSQARGDHHPETEDEEGRDHKRKREE